MADRHLAHELSGLGRKVEESVLCEIIHHARRRGIERLIGEYIPTGRNTMVQYHYHRLGFTFLSEDGIGRSLWSLETRFDRNRPPHTSKKRRP